MFSKNLSIFLSIILFFALGLISGYSLKGGSKTADKCFSGNTASGAAPRVQNQNIKINLAAREAYSIALSEARRWSQDAYLSGINLESKKFDSNGLSNGWKIIFYSKTENKLYEIIIKDGESRGGEETAATKAPQTLKGEMIDSLVLAKSFYGAYPADTEITSLKMYYDAGAKKFIWTIFFPKGSHTIDAEI